MVINETKKPEPIDTRTAKEKLWAEFEKQSDDVLTLAYMYSRGYDRGSYRGSYNDGGSYAMGRGRGRYANRDSMGRYSSNDGYSRSGSMADELRDLMNMAPDEQTRQEMQRLIQKMESR